MKIATTVADALKLLWQEKVFLKPKDFKSIELELSKRGYNFIDKNLLMALMRSNFLTRKGQKGNYSYVQKHPFMEETTHGTKQDRR
jgi:hypothetical protein